MSGKSKAEEVLQDNPDAMHDLMQKIRSDPNYITSLYKDCPGMRQVLDEHPDLKKIFENPDIMRRSFEAVYIKNGGEPEPVDEDDSDYESDTDEDDYESSYGGSNRRGKAYGDAGTLATEDFDDDDTLARQKKALKKKRAEEKAARNPSKAVKFLSKLVGMRGIVILVISFMSPFKIVRKLGEVFFEGDIEPPSGDAALAADACNAAADHFDDPAVAEEMDRLLEENPDNLDEIVENDETLRNLRDSDPIAAELMRDPETFKVITDGENLRAMGELTEAMQADFANGLDGGGGVDAAANAMDALNTADAVGDAADAADAAGDAGDDYEEPELGEEEEGGAADDAQEYLQDAELEDDDMKKTGRKGQRGKGKNQRNRGGQAAQGAKDILGAGISAVAGGFLGDAMGDMMDFGGGEDLAGVAGEDMGGLEDVAADAELVDAADVAEAAQDAGEGGLATEELMVMGAAGGAVVAAGAVGGAYVMSRDGKKKDGQEGSEGQASGQQDGDASDEKDKKKKGMFGELKSGAGNLATFVADTAKETLVTTVLGDDMGDAVLEAKDGVEEAQEELASDSEKESDDDSRRDDAKDRRSGQQQRQGRQRSSHGQRYEGDDWDEGEDWNYDRQKSWR